MILRVCENLENSLKRKSPNALSAAQRNGGGGEYTPDATRGCMKNAFLNTGANCKRYICTVLHNVM
jgi:hypothetical protein